jgi:proton-coupled amino acid transporter
MAAPERCGDSSVANEAVGDPHTALRRGAEGTRNYGAAAEPWSSRVPWTSGVGSQRTPPSLRQWTPRGFRRQLTPLAIQIDPKTGREVPAGEGSYGLTPTALAIVKSFVGSGITFMPGAFAQGGWLFSSLVLSAIACVNGACIYLLVQCQDRQINPGASFACIADSACGWVGRLAVQVSLVISQFGTCIAYIIFISQLVQSIGHVGSPWIMCVLFPLLVPLCLIRTVDHLEYPNLIADTLILFGLLVVIVYGCITMASADAIDDLLYSIRRDDANWRDKLMDPHYGAVVPFKPDTCGIFIGMAIFTFEGVPMMLPIRNSMAKQERFIPLFVGVFACISLFFCAFGLIGYISYKERVETVVLLNLPDESALPIVAKFGYMLALCFSTPLMFLPAAHITELWVFGASDDDPDQNGDRVWRINAMRTFEILLFCLIAVLCGPHFERFLAFVGALCCAPVAFVYPALFHLVLCADGATAKTLDVLLIAVGFGAMAFALFSAILGS